MLAAITLALLSLATLGASEEGAKNLIKRGDNLFRSGRFAEAEKVYRAAVADDDAGSHAVLRLGEIALLGNRFAEAERHLQRAVKLRPDDKRPKSLLAEVYYRQDDFRQAAPLLREVGSEAVAAKLASFEELTPYDIVGDATTTRLKFVRTDPLPVVRLSVNGSEDVFFIIDTGASEVYLDPDFADRVGAVRFGATQGSFAGGKPAAVQHARIDSLRLGDVDVRNVPVVLLPTGPFAMATGGLRIEGVIGTVLFYHFAATLDYPKGELVLRRRTAKVREELDKQAKTPGTQIVPFWMAKRHFMVAWGEVNNRERCLMFVDTGLAGGGFLCPESTLKAAAIDISGLPSFEGMGGGGPIKITPFKVDTLSLGDVVQRNVMGSFGGFPPSTEYDDTGFRIGGIISHTFFRPFALTFDFDRMQLYLSPGQ